MTTEARPFCVLCDSPNVLLLDPPPSFRDVMCSFRLDSNSCFNCIQGGVSERTSAVRFRFVCSERIKGESCRYQVTPLENVFPLDDEDNVYCMGCGEKPDLIIQFKPCDHGLCLNCHLFHMELCLKQKTLIYNRETDGILIPCPDRTCEKGVIENIHWLKELGSERQIEITKWKDEMRRKDLT